MKSESTWAVWYASFPGERSLRGAAWIALGFWPWVVISTYLSWSVAWLQLGHRPICMVNDPKHLGSYSSMVSWLVAWSWAFGFFLWGGALVVLLVGACRGSAQVQSRLWLAKAFFVSVLVIAWLRFDPWRAMEWFMD